MPSGGASTPSTKPLRCASYVELSDAEAVFAEQITNTQKAGHSCITLTVSPLHCSLPQVSGAERFRNFILPGIDK